MRHGVRVLALSVGLMMCCFASARALSYRLLVGEGCMPCSNSVVYANGDVDCGSQNCTEGCEYGNLLASTPEEGILFEWCGCNLGIGELPTTCFIKNTYNLNTGAHSQECVGSCDGPDCPTGSTCKPGGASYPKSCRCKK